MTGSRQQASFVDGVIRHEGHEAAKRAWRSSPQAGWPDENTYVRQIQPRLAAVTISALASTLGVSEPYAAYIRAGRHCPHPGHWETGVANG